MHAAVEMKVWQSGEWRFIEWRESAYAKLCNAASPRLIVKAGEEIFGQGAHHSAAELPAHLGKTISHVGLKKINWPKMSDTNKWKALNVDLSTTLDYLLKGLIQERLQAFSGITDKFL